MIFISHNSQDKESAREIGIYLVAEGLDVWFDEWQIAAGDSITGAINEGLAQASHFLVVWSKNASRAVWVKRELESALNRSIETGSPKIVPIVLDEEPLPELLRDRRYIRYQGGSEENRNELVSSIKGESPSQTLVRMIVKKYNELVFDEYEPIFHLRACPSCGNARLKGSSATDYRHDEVYFFIECTECGWSDMSQ